ncbi:MAG: hypothetical protein NZ700_09965 [Gemmataceae bacterium]|nr:hypothetical protein [Gemmataceae bacterium]MDW8264185.1 hypothetical protein [Gemmataceae bacterium]
MARKWRRYWCRGLWGLAGAMLLLVPGPAWPAGTDETDADATRPMGVAEEEQRVRLQPPELAGGAGPKTPEAQLLQPVPFPKRPPISAVPSQGPSSARVQVVLRPPNEATDNEPVPVVPIHPVIRLIPTWRSSDGPKPAPEERLLPLTGTHPASIDERGRLVLPARILEQLGPPPACLYVAAGPDGCVWICTSANLERLVPASGPTAEGYAARRLCFAHIECLPLEAGGRLTLPPRLARYAGLEREAIITGVDDHLEVWNPRRWRQYLERHLPSWAEGLEPASAAESPSRVD